MSSEVLINQPKKQRNAMLDVVRILAMLFIVIHHLTINNIGLSDIENGVAASLIPQYLGTSFIDVFVIIGVNVFFLISGYFSIKLKPRKILLLLFKVYIYWILSVLIGMASGLIKFAGVLDGLKYCVIAVSKYWFILIYMMLCLFAPALNEIAKLIVGKRGGVKYFVFISTVFFCVIGFVADYFYPIMGTNNGYSVIWAAVPYLYGRIIFFKKDELKNKPVFWFIAFVLLSLANYAIIAPLIATGHGKVAWHFYGYNNPLIMASSLCFVMTFISMKPITNPKASKVISFIAQHTLAVYLLHSNNPLLGSRRAFFIEKVSPLWAKFAVLIPNALVLFAIGIAVDALYELLLSKPLNFISQKFEKLCLFLYEKFMNAFSKLFRQKPSSTEQKN